MYTDLYKNALYVRTENNYDVFKSNLKDYDHYNIALKVYALLRKLGFKIRTTKYHADQNYNKDRNKVAIKDFVAVKMEVNNRQFEIEICHLYNLEPTNELNIWRYTDSRFKPFSYLEDKKIQLIRNKIERLLPNKEYKDDDKLSSLELILKKEAENPHVHNGAKSFEDIKNYVETDTYTSNYLDRNKNRIACGETKYFYDYHNNRLSRGIALHNINNMWWILMSDGSRRNIASFDLFDYEKHLPRRKQSLARLESFYKKSIEAEDFERCIKLKKEIQKHKTSRLQESAIQNDSYKM